MISPSNLLMHNITPLLALVDFVLCDYGYHSRRRHILLGAIMPIGYMIYAYLLSFCGVLFRGEIVPYFFLNYEKFGWFSISDAGLGVVYWILILTLLIFIISAALLWVKDARKKRVKS